ncbi:hypothetical protein JCM10450v2_006439 [Rhodotorula kratochvilovae]
MSTQHPIQTALEASHKATLLQLSRVLAFQARLQQQGATQYAPSAPKQLTQPLEAEAANFASICDQLEQRVLRAIAVLERDARKAAGISPLPAAPSPLAAPPPPAVELAQPPAEDAPLPFALPPSTATSTPAASAAPPTQPMQLDLTLSPSPPPTTGAGTGDATMPFQLPGSTLSGSSGGRGGPVMLDLTGDDPVAPSGTSAGVGDAAASDDINALLASLNMPPFGLASSTSSSAAAAAPAPAASAPGAFPDLSLDALNALMAGTSSAPPPSSGPPANAQAGASAGLDALGLSLDPATSSSSGFPALDLSSFGAAGGAGDGGFGALGEMDFTSFAAVPASSGGGAGAGDASLEELLKSLGGGV